MSVFIRECTVADVPELEAICQETFADTYGDGENEEDLQAHRKSFKRLGLGKHLIMKAIELAEEAEKETVWLGVWEHNHPAQKFYQSLGFVKTDEHDFYMGNERHTDYTMTKQLKEST